MSGSSATKPAGLSVFFPAYNDSGTIASMVIRAVQVASELTPDYEVIVVSDGSIDDTYHQALTVAGPHVKVFGYTPNMGKGFALRYGFERSTGDPVTFIDAPADNLTVLGTAGPWSQRLPHFRLDSTPSNGD